ncbi:MAG: amino acid adenylation domain-containing protein, partial [Bacteroidales bacterium]|nr:amino acid adenylation domain-containing protein [Bacteroidales bacterium]
IGENNDKYLCAYVVCKKEFKQEELRAYMSSQVPDYMVPSHIVQLNELPLTSNGKVNRKALPTPEIKAGDDYVAPSTEIEANLLEIWSEVLNIEKEAISTTANFFSIGGHSLKATILTGKIFKEIGVEFPLRDVFLHSTIKSQASQIETSTKKEFVSIPKAKEQSNYPVSPAQYSMYMLQQMDLESTAYNMPYEMTFDTGADRKQIEEVFKQIILRHESFRTSFELKDEELFQHINTNVDFRLEENLIDRKEFKKFRKEFIRPFDLSQAPLLRAVKVDVKDEGSFLIIDMHHIISDGTTKLILEREFKELYAGNSLPEQRLQYRDYSEWQQSEEQQEKIGEQEKYWEGVFEGEFPVLSLPTDYIRPALQSHEGATTLFALSKEETEGLKSLASENGLTLYMSIMSVYTILLSKLSGQEDIVVGIPIAGRNHSDLENVVGLLLNTLAIRNKVQEKQSIKDYLEQLRQVTLLAFENQDYKFDDLIEMVSQEHDPSRNPVFDVMFNLMNQAEYNGDLSELDKLNIIHTPSMSKFDLNLTAVDHGEQVLFSLEYCTKLFKSSTIDRYIGYFKKIAQQIVNSLPNKISELEIITEEEKQKLLYGFNNTKSDFPNDKTIHQLFEEQVLLTPDKIVATKGGECLTYGELNKRANQLALYCQKKGVTTESKIGLFTDHSLEMLIGMLGSLKSGGCYVPIDRAYPEERINYIIEDSGIEIMLKSQGLSPVVDSAILIDLSDSRIYTGSGNNLETRVSPSNLSYMIYTSGSTGKPKGVMVEHRNVVAYISAFQGEFKLDERDVVMQQASISFDTFVEEVYPIITIGGRLVLVEKEEILNLDKFGKLIQRNNITVISCSPLLLNEINTFPHKLLENVRLFISGGDELRYSHINEIIKFSKVYNTYGPTEATVCSLYYECKGKSTEHIPIGSPIANDSVFVLGTNMELLPIGVAGELCISGSGLSRGYYKNESLTKEKFIDHPFEERERLYRTGDLARWLPDGNIEFLGRIDHQVKIRGFRIELGEIENVLFKHENIKECIVTAIEENNEKYLCAYMVCKEKLNHEELRTYMSAQVPDYMVPSYFVELESLPLNSNGKVNHKALPSPQIKAGDDYVAPSNEIEEKLVEIWSEVLNIEKDEISTIANFFAIGGHSLKATVLTSKIHKEIGVEFPLRDVFLHSTIKSQASQIERSTKIEFVSIPKAQEQSNYPLSSAQKRLYLLQQFDLKSTAYNISNIIPLGKEFDKGKIEEVFKQLINRHESFRTSIIVVDNEPVQLISKNVAFELGKLSIETTELENTRNKFIKPFDLSKAPFLRVTIVDVKGEDSLLMLDMHHIISDATSHSILGKEFQTLLLGEELAPLPLQYKDYSEWQNSEEQQEFIKDQEQYWLTKFEGEIPVLNLPMDYVRPLMQSNEGATVNFVLSKEETERLRFFTKENDLTLYMTLLSVFNILLSKLSGQDDIVVGAPIAGRNHADLENIVGMFINTLSIRNEVKGEETIRDFVSSIKQTILGAYENQNYQFEDLVDKVSVERDTGRNPIFDVVINLLNQAERSGDLSGFNNQEQVHEIGISKFDLTLAAIDYGEQLMLSFEYCTQLFKAETIDRFIVYFKQIVNQLARKPEIKISAIDILTEAEKHQLLYEFNNTKADYPKDKTIHQLFEEQVEQYPDKLALKYKNKTFTYQELNEESNQIAHYLIEKGLRREEIVGIVLESSYQYVASIFAVLKAGGAFLPIDKKLPDLRKKYIIENSELKILIHNDISYEKNASEDIASINMEKLDVQNYPLTNPSLEINSSNLAYVIYTSGSTGKPKGTLLEHKGIVSENIFWKESFKIQPTDRCLQFANISFDASVAEIYSCLFNGASLYIPDENIKKDIGLFEEYLIENQITVATFPPPFADNMNESTFKNFRLVITAGSETNSKLIEKINKNAQYLNAYGPTETSICATYWDTSEFSKIGKIVIGRSIQNIEAYILDSHLQLQGIGISGELCFSGEGLARGYLKNTELTAEKFIPNPFKKGERLYCTGDLARWLPDGNIEFLGRIDHQVKIRGFRIELGEIESVLLKHENIKETVVLAREENGDKYLCAYIVSKEELNHDELRAYMSSQVPDYMLPSYFVELESLPLNANGKVNRKALPSPEIKAGDDYVAPSNAIEEKLVEIWSEILKIDKEDISVNANFFSIGGHSLKATVLTSNIHKEIGVEFPLREVFLHSTIKSQASQIATSTKKEFVSIPKAKEQSNYSLSPAQKRLYLLQQFDLTATTYNMPNLISLGKEVDKSRIKDVFKQLIKRHESFRTSINIVDQVPVQLISKDVEFELEELSIEYTELEHTRNKFIKPFDLSKAPFLRVAIVHIQGKDSLLMIDMHHIISDGATQGILEKEFQALFSGEELAPLPLQYKDYSQWQNSKEQQEHIKNQEQYWLNKFEGEIPVLNLPSDYVRPLIQSHEGATVNFVLSKEETEGIKTFTKENDLTLYMSLLSVFNILLSKLSRQDDIIVGTPIAGRNHADLENIVGMFINTLSIRNEVKGEETIQEFVSSLKQKVLGAYENQNYQFEDLVDKVSVERDTSRNPILDVMINLLNQAEYSGDISGINNEDLIHTKGVSKFDLALIAVDYGEQLMLSFEYCTQLFKAETIDRFIAYFKQIVGQLAEKSEIKISAIDILSEEEKHQLLYTFNDTKLDYPKNKTIHQLFEEQVEKTPNNIAVIFENKQLTYRELDEKANQLGHYLKAKGVKPESLVGICVDRSFDMIIGILGILKSGGAYVPIDPAYPDNRIAYMLQDSECNILLTQGHLKFPQSNSSLVYLDKDWDKINEETCEKVNSEVQSNNLAYVIYTSGSTGMPKGVLVEHKSVVNYINWSIITYQFNTNDVVGKY